MGRLSFAIALNLITDNFKKGVNDVKSGFSSMQAKILTFSAAFDLIKNAFAGFSSQVIGIVRQTNEAMTALKNVSGSTAEFADNQKYLISVSKKYGTNVNDLSAAYAKFTASAKLAGMPLSVQKSLFESVSRATAAFALNSEDTNSVFLALSQMMGKGKIQAQELRLQMGEKLPVALQAMAKAAGVSVGELDNMMQKGELLSGKVLPNFGKALDELIPKVDTDHLETSVNKWQNAKIAFLKATPVSDTYKLFIDSLTGALTGLTEALNSTGVQNFFDGFKKAVTGFADYVKSNFRSLVVDIVALLAGIKISQLFSQWKAFSKSLSEAMITNSTVAHSKIRILESSTNRLKRQIATEEANLDKLSADERLGAEVQLNAKKRQLANTETLLMKAKNTARVADERAAAVQSGNAWEATWAKIKTGATALSASLKAVWTTVGPMILITLVTELIGKFYELYNRSQQIKNAYKDYRTEASKAVHTREITELESLQKQYNAAKKNSKERFDFEKRIGDLTGQKVTGERDINKLLNQRIGLLKSAAAVEFYTNKVLSVQDRQDELKRKYGGNAPGSKAANNYFYDPSHRSVLQNLNPFIGNEYVSDIEEYKANRIILADADKKLASAERDAAKYTVKEAPYKVTDDGTGKTKKDPAKTQLENAEQSYAEAMMKISLEEKKGLKTAEEANKARQQLVISTYSDLATSKYPKVRNSDFTKELAKKYDQIAANGPFTEFKDAEKEFYKKQEELKNNYAYGAISQDDFNKGTVDLIVEGKKLLATYGNMAKVGSDFWAEQIAFATGLATMGSSIKQKLPVEAQRDTTFDYKKSKTDILGEQLDNAKKQLDALKSLANQDAEEVVNAIGELGKRIPKLSTALGLAEVREDIKNLKKELSLGQAWEDFKGVAGSVQDIGSAFQNLSKTMSNADSSSWEKILSVWQALQSSVDGVLNVIDMINRWTKASDELGKMKAAEAALIAKSNVEEAASSTVATGAALIQSATQVAASDKIGAAKMAEASTTVSADTTEIASTLTSTAVSTVAAKITADNNKKTVAGNMASAGSEVVKQKSKIPIVGIALAAAGLVAILGLMHKLPKFANGGIVGGGSTSGDNMLARVNSGEMILNGGQQRRLFNIANGNGGGTPQQTLVSTKVRGEDMFLAIKNYMRSKNKKW